MFGSKCLNQAGALSHLPEEGGEEEERKRERALFPSLFLFER